jgi:hypothetical protein
MDEKEKKTGNPEEPADDETTKGPDISDQIRSGVSPVWVRHWASP